MAVNAHVYVGQYTLPVPLIHVLIGAVIVVGASFALIYLVPPRRQQGDAEGTVLADGVGFALVAVAGAYYAFIALVSLFGRQQQTLLNGGALLFWIWTIPVLPVLHCFVGGMYEVGNPFAWAARHLSGGRRLARADAIVDRLGYWPAAVLLLGMVWAESVGSIARSPLATGVIALGYGVLQVSMGILLGARWYRAGDVFQATTNLASALAPIKLRRNDAGKVSLVVGFDPSHSVAVGAGREALITLWLAGVLADGVRQLPVWKLTIGPAVVRVIDAAGGALGPDTEDIISITAEILVTWAAFAAFFWLFGMIAAALSGRSLREVAGIVSPSLVPIALAYLLAHNLTALSVLGPFIVTARDATESQLPLLVSQAARGVKPGVIWWIQVTAIVIGHILAVVMAHARLHRGFAAGVGATPRSARQDGQTEAMVLRADLGWLTAMLIYTATSLWILAQPITG